MTAMSSVRAASSADVSIAWNLARGSSRVRLDDVQAEAATAPCPSLTMPIWPRTRAAEETTQIAPKARYTRPGRESGLASSSWISAISAMPAAPPAAPASAERIKVLSEGPNNHRIEIIPVHRSRVPCAETPGRRGSSLRRPDPEKLPRIRHLRRDSSPRALASVLPPSACSAPRSDDRDGR